MERATRALLGWTMCLVACGPAGDAEPHEAAAEGAVSTGPTFVTLDEPTAARVHVTTQPVVALATGAPVVALGELTVDEHRYALVDAPAPGRVLRLLAHVGDTVVEGTELAEIASGEVGEMRSDLASATARIRTAEAALERRRGLAAEHIASTADVEEAENTLAEARADASRAGAALRAADARGTGRASLVIRSPIAGTVLDHHAFPGEAATEDDHLFEISDLSSLWLLVHVPERDAGSIREGDVARVSFAARPDEVLELPVALVGATVESDTRSVELRIDVPNADRTLRPGMSASVLVVPAAGSGTTLVVPSSAVQHTSTGWAVFVPSGDRTYEMRHVVTGRDLGGEVEIITGLEAGEVVAVEGAFLLRSLADAGEWGEAG